MPQVLPSKIPEEPQFFEFWVGKMRLLIVEDAKKKLAPPQVYTMTSMAANVSTWFTLQKNFARRSAARIGKRKRRKGVKL